LEGLLQKPDGIRSLLALDVVAPHGVNGLGREAQVAHHGDLGVDHQL
jgi:peptidoglycan/LPS O-acetylase OafA/YrhL